MTDRFSSFSELSRHKKEGEHYSIIIKETGRDDILILAPHGGTIENGTSAIAERIASNNHNLYIFEGIEQENSFSELHVTSTGFDETRCLALVARMDTVIAIHGCLEKTEVIYLGGRDEKLKISLAEAFNKNGIRAETQGHAYPAQKEENICNRGKRNRGVQIEFSKGIRDNPQLVDRCVEILRKQFVSPL